MSTAEDLAAFIVAHGITITPAGTVEPALTHAEYFSVVPVDELESFLDGWTPAKAPHKCPYPAAGCTSPDCEISTARCEQRAYERGHRDAADKAAAELARRDQAIAAIRDACLEADLKSVEQALDRLLGDDWFSAPAPLNGQDADHLGNAPQEQA